MYSKLTLNLDQFIKYQLEQYRQVPVKKKEIRPVITISREFGCEGFPVAKLLAEKLKSESKLEWLIYNRELVDRFSDTTEFDNELMESLSKQQRSQVDQFVDHILAHKPNNYALYKKMARSVKALSERGYCIIVGSGGAILTADLPNCIHIRLKAPYSFRIQRISRELQVSENEARKIIENNDQSRVEMIRNFTKHEVEDSKFYDLIIDNERFNSHQITEHIILALNQCVPGWQPKS